MTSDRQEYFLKDLISVKHGYAFKGNSIISEDNGVVLVTPGNFAIGGGFQENKCKYFSANYPKDYILRSGDLIVTMTDLSKAGDTLGYSAIVPKSARIYLHNQRIGLVEIHSDLVDKEYLYWFMRTHNYQKAILASSSGSVIKHTSPSRIGDIRITLPAISKQKQVASMLSSIENKIVENKKINHHLEQMAQAIFKSWFVDFEPFGGTIPTTWKIGKLTDVATYLNGLAMQRFRPNDGENGLPVLKIKELRQGFCDMASELCSPNIKPDYIVHDGDVIFSWSGSLLVDFWCGGDCGLNQHLFKVTSTAYDKWFFYSWTRHHLTKFIAMAADKATTMGHIKREALENAKVLIPTDKEYRRIGQLLTPLYEKIVDNRLESRQLMTLRDTLLPRLMSGELSVSAIDDGK